MADRGDLEFTYSIIDRVFRVSLGELADFSGAKYDGDFSLSLEEAQRRKHEYVAGQIGIGPGRRVLDLGCGWGPLLNFIREHGAVGVGTTLSSAQTTACRRHGLDVHLKDARQVTRETFGPFDAVASLGAFEHFCSPDDHRAGRQEEVYRSLFARIASLLPEGGRLYLQTMVFGRNMIPLEEIDINAPRDSDAWYLALMGRQFPGSWLPSGSGADRPHSRAAFPPGIEGERAARLHRDNSPVAAALRGAQPPEDPAEARASPALARQLRLPARLHVGGERQRVCFERELLDHFRLVFERAGEANRKPLRPGATP